MHLCSVNHKNKQTKKGKDKPRLSYITVVETLEKPWSNPYNGHSDLEWPSSQNFDNHNLLWTSSQSEAIQIKFLQRSFFHDHNICVFASILQHIPLKMGSKVNEIKNSS